MTSPATQEPCPKCKDQGVVVDAAGRIIPCDCIWGTPPAPPSQRAELLPQELESAMAKLRKSAAAEQNHRLSEAEAAALLQHIAALQSQLDTAQKDNLARHRQCGELRAEVAALTQRVEAADKLIDRCLELVRGDIEQFGPCDHSVGCCICGEVRLADDIAAYRALSQEPPRE